MQQYNMIVLEGQSPSQQGLKVMSTDAYREMISKDPGVCHQNLGNFFSYADKDYLAETIYENIQGNFAARMLFSDLEMITENEFDASKLDKDKQYLVKDEDHNARLYFPENENNSLTNNPMAMEMYAFMIGQELFADGTEGTYQKNAREMMKTMTEMAGKMFNR